MSDNRPKATPEQLKRAKNEWEYSVEGLCIDNDAVVSLPEDDEEQGFWISAWIWVPGDQTA